MLGKRSPQGEIFKPENRFRKKIGEKSFYVFLSDNRHKIFNDEDFEKLYCRNNGRNSTPPSLLTLALILQTYTKTTDQEATDRAKYDQRWQKSQQGLTEKILRHCGLWKESTHKSTSASLRYEQKKHLLLKS